MEKDLRWPRYREIYYFELDMITNSQQIANILQKSIFEFDEGHNGSLDST